MAQRPEFFLVNPVARSLVISDKFNHPRAYAFAPDKLQKHEGVDIMAIDAQGQPTAVLAAQRGVVDRVGFSAQGYGNYVRIVHRWGSETYVTWYGHLSATTVTAGQFVRAGQKVGIAGTTGFSSGIHLHLTLQHLERGLKNYVIDDVIDPEPFLQASPAPDYDELTYLADITAPDGTVMRPGQEFDKVWRVRNTGTTSWDAGHKLVFVGNDPMGAPDEVALQTAPVFPGSITNIKVKLTAPASGGTHRSTWALRSPDGDQVDFPLFAEIVIEDSSPVDEMSYVADVTVEDGTLIQPGAEFIKIWRVRNTGSTTWNQQYALRWVGGNRMNGPDRVPLTRTVPPGDTVEITVILTSPEQEGRHRSTWQLHDSNGKAFPFKVFAEIQVPQQTAVGRINEMRWVADVTIPDGTLMEPGTAFDKVWRVRNTGDKTWGPGYELVFFGDDHMQGPASVPLPAAKPGDVVEVSVPLVAPDIPGEHRSTWKARDPQGKFFEFDVFALIEVMEEQVQLDEMSWIKDVTVEDGSAMRPGETFVKTWRVRNSGTTTWGPGYNLVFASDSRMHGPDQVALPAAKPGDVVDVSVMLKSPTQAGIHKSTWKGRTPNGDLFDYGMYALIDVVDPSQTFDLLEYLRGDGRLYELEFNWHGGGVQRVQTQVDGHKFYHVKHSEWEEMWSDEHFIYRGTDTSPGNGEVYQLSENGQHGSPWIPRRMRIGAWFRRTPMVIFRRKSDGAVISHKQGIHTTWIKLDTVHARHRLASGIELQHVAVLAAYVDQGGSPAPQPFERYFYAKKYGLVAWKGELGQSFLVREFLPGTIPNLVREHLAWL